jgi:Rrf2 family protein
MLNRFSQVAIAAAGHLAEIHSDPERRLSSGQIAKSRKLKLPFVAKVLTQLSQAGIVRGAPGPGGGYRLSRAPETITLAEITSLFEPEDDRFTCPYGPDYCGHGPNCPLHDQVVSMRDSLQSFLDTTTLEGFCVGPGEITTTTN